MTYILVMLINLAAMMDRLDLIRGPSPFTTHYTAPINPNIPTYPYVLLPIDDRAQSVLTPEEWASRLATMPTEFIRPMPE